MRIALLFIMLSYASFLSAQLYQSATWYTSSGGLDTGVLRLRNIQLSTADEYAFGHFSSAARSKRSKFQPCPYSDVEWLVVAGDTVLHTFEKEGQRQVLQLWRKGDVSLYATLAKRGARDFFWRDWRGRWYELHEQNISQMAKLIGECGMVRLGYAKNRWSDTYLIALTKALNKCLGTEVSLSVLSWNTHTNELSYALNWPAEINTLIESSVDVVPISLWGASYQRRLFKNIAAWYGEIGIRYWHYQLNDSLSFAPRANFQLEGDYYHEQLDIKQWYPHLGVKLLPLHQQRVSLFIGAGLLAVIPQYYTRSLTIVEGMVRSGQASRQIIDTRLPPRLGWYGAIGLRGSLTTSLWMQLQFCSEQIRQRIDYPANFIATTHIRRAEIFTPNQIMYWQLSAQYTW